VRDVLRALGPSQRIEQDLASLAERAQQIRDVLRALGPVTLN
jgi:hypothetical protein